MWHDYGKPRPWIESARQPFVAYFLMWGLIATPLVIFLCNRFPIERRNWLARFLLHLGLFDRFGNTNFSRPSSSTSIRLSILQRASGLDDVQWIFLFQWF